MHTFSSGIQTREARDNHPYGFIIEWINWDSYFRNSNLEPGDMITGLNNKKYTKEMSEPDRSKAIGNFLESTYWEEHGGKDGDNILLEVWREGKMIEVPGKISKLQVYLDKEERLALSPDGPTRLNNDGFSSAWSNWYEKFQRHASRYIADWKWERSAIDNRSILSEHLEWKPRIDYLVKNYPGRFADMLLKDWEKVRQILEGRTYTDISEETLEYRKIGKQRVALVREAAITGRSAFLDKLSLSIIPAFPAPDPVYANLKEAAGKIVVLPALTLDNFINDLGKSYAVAGNKNDGYYFIYLNSKEADIFFKTLFYYQSQVTPDVKESYQFIAEIMDQPTILTYEGRSVKGLMVKILSGTAGEENVFIDISKTDITGKATFEGQESLSIFSGYPLDDTASPQQVIEAMIEYIKLGDMQSWRKLFGNWKIYSQWEGPTYMDLAYWFTDENYQHTWEKSRRQILNDIYDARILYVSPVIKVTEENKSIGVPGVEQVKIIIDHIGKPDGVYRSISNLYVHRNWTLQRLNTGPWKITELQPL